MGGDQAYKGFALALLVDLLGGALLGTDGYGAVALLAGPHGEPVAGLRSALEGRRMPGDGSMARRTAAAARGRSTFRTTSGSGSPRLDQADSSAASCSEGSLGIRRDSTFDSPSPAIVTPYSTSATSIVRRWCVMTMNCALCW